jgi:thymidylate synthase (FAD)
MSGIEGNLIKQSVFPPTVKAIAQAEQALRRAIAVCEESYIRMVQLGIPAEDARYALPNSTQTNIIVTMNARELMHFFTLRCCERAQWEIRAMATVMLFIAHKVFPVAFNKAGPSCVRGPCSEGSMTCGKIMEVRHKFQIAA